jgi:putative ABC transport system substrate-binding protein
MQRREFVTALGGVTAMWPFTARAQQSERMRRIGVPMSTSADDPEGQARIAAFALAPDVIVATGVYVGPLLQQATQTVPIVFVLVADPVGAGFVASLARPGGNATGFSFSEYGIGAKWLELLKEVTPGVTRVAVLGIPLIRGAG